MTVTTVRALLSEVAEPKALGLELPDLTTAAGSQEVAAWALAHGYGALLPLCRKKLLAEPQNIDVLLLQTECLLHQGLFDAARASAERARAIAPSRRDVAALYTLATAEDGSAEAGSTAEPQAEDADEPWALAARAKDLFVRGDGRALQLANRAVALDPNNVWARFVQTDLTAQLVGAQDSAAGAEALRALAPKSSLAMWCVIRSQTPPLRQQLSPSVRDVSMPNLAQIDALAPGGAWACLAAAHLGVCGGAGLPALSTQASVSADGPKLSMVLCRARALADGGDSVAALEALSEAPANTAQSYPMWAMKAELYAALGDTQEAVRCAQQARPLASGSQYQAMCLRLAGLCIADGQLEAAIKELQAVLRQAPTHTEALVMLAQLRLKGSGSNARQDELQDAHALAERALRGDALYHPQAHFIIGLAASDPELAQRHLRLAIKAFEGDAGRVFEAQNALVVRLVESGNYGDAQAVLDTLPEDIWDKLVEGAYDPRQKVSKFRARRLAETTIIKCRAALAAKNFYQAIVDIEEAERSLDIREDADLYATLLGIKSLAYLEVDLRTDARETARRAVRAARGSASMTTVTEAELVRTRLAEIASSERKKWVVDFITRYVWLIIGASGAGSLYTVGMSLIKMMQDAFNNSNSRARVTAHMRPQPERGGTK